MTNNLGGGEETIGAPGEVPIAAVDEAALY